MKKFIKYGSIVVISLVILISCNVNSYDCDVFAEEKNEEQNTETDIICNWPEDIIDRSRPLCVFESEKFM